MGGLCKFSQKNIEFQKFRDKLRHHRINFKHKKILQGYPPKEHGFGQSDMSRVDIMGIRTEGEDQKEEEPKEDQITP